MSIESVATNHVKLFPDQVKEPHRGWPYQLAGLALVIVTVTGWLSLLTWSVSDPSLSFATAAAPRNLLGPLGAILSDLTFQMLGLTAIFAYLPPFVWGVQFLWRRQVPNFKHKILLYPLAILILAGALSSLPMARSWPLNHGYGGIVGDLVLGLAVSLLSTINSQRAVMVAGMAYFAGGFAALFGALGLTQNELQLLLQRPAGAGGGQTNSSYLDLVSWASISKGLRALWRRFGARAAQIQGGDWGLVPGVAPGRTDHESTGWHPASPDLATSPVDGAANISDEMRTRETFSVVSAADAPEETGAMPDTDPLPRMFREAPSAANELQPSLDFGPMPAAPDSRAMAERFAPEGVPAGAGAAVSQSVPGDSLSAAGDHASVAVNGRTAQNANAKEQGKGPLAGAGFLRALTMNKPRSGGYQRPALSMLKRAASKQSGQDFTQNVLRGNARLLEDVLGDFGIKGEIKDIKPGPVVTSFELEPARGTKSSRVIALGDDIARSMSATSARVAVVPGRNAIAIELPNAQRDTVMLRDVLEAPAFKSSEAVLPLALGKSISGEPVITDLARMPHLLVAGTTGSGKSVGVNAMILSLLYRLSPEQCRLLLIDPKMLELSVYNGIPHLLTPVVTDPHKAVSALGWAVREMEERYKRMSQLSVRNIGVFNNRVRNAKKRGEQLARTVQTGFDPLSGRAIYEREEFDLEPMPYIVIVVDEFADLMSVAGKEIEALVQRLAQMARAAGIHLIMATQRPSVDIITGTIKANFPTRISFKVTSKIDSRTILNEQGAEQLLGHGDMLYSGGMGQIARVHGPFVSDEEVEQIAEFLRGQGAPDYVEGVTDGDELQGEGAGSGAGGSGAGASGGSAKSANDDLYDKAVAIVINDQKVSTSYIQRRLSIGYNRAADLVERMETAGIISAASPTGKRQILAGSPGGPTDQSAPNSQRVQHGVGGSDGSLGAALKVQSDVAA